MGQKVHPVGFRLGYTKKHQSGWFTTPKKYPIFIAQDHFLRSFLFENYGSAGISGIQIQRKLHEIQLTLQTQNPQFILKGNSKGLDLLKKQLETQLHLYTIKFIFQQKKYQNYKNEYDEKPIEISIYLRKLKKPYADVSVLGSLLVDQLETRVAFRRAMKTVIESAQKAKVKGIKIQVSGRLNGAEMARSEWIRHGRVPLHTLRANIDYTYTTAKTIYGLLGIKIWIFHGEKIS